MRTNLKQVKEQQLYRLANVHFCGLDNAHVFLCVQTRQPSGLDFVLIPHSPQ